MCFKRTTLAPITSKYIYVGFGINDYMGSANDLRGCVNDINDEVKKLKKEFPEFQCLTYFDRQVTTHFFVDEIQRIMSQMPEDGFLYIKYSGHGTQIPCSTEPDGYDEALYLYNGPLIDNELWNLQQQTPLTLKVLAKFDSCHSGDMGSRFFGNPSYRKARFMPIQGMAVRRIPVTRIAKPEGLQRWIIISGCKADQVSMDAQFNGRFNGAFSYFDIPTYFRGMLLTENRIKTGIKLSQAGFAQVPEISGPYEYETFLSNK